MSQSFLQTIKDSLSLQETIKIFRGTLVWSQIRFFHWVPSQGSIEVLPSTNGLFGWCTNPSFFKSWGEIMEVPSLFPTSNSIYWTGDYINSYTCTILKVFFFFFWDMLLWTSRRTDHLYKYITLLPCGVVVALSLQHDDVRERNT